jgi:hypothetical protein
MAILRIASARADITTLGGTMSTDSTYFDNTRVDACYRISEDGGTTLGFPAAAGTTTWLHWVFAFDADPNQFLYDRTVTTIQDTNGATLFEIRMNASDFHFSVLGDTTAKSGGFLLPEKAEIVIDIQLIVTGTTDIELNAYINSALRYSQTVLNTVGRTNPAVLEISNPNHAVEPIIYTSEFIIADEDTRGFRMRELKPQSFGVFKQWDGTVASVVDDSLATGISTDVLNERTSFGLDRLDQVDEGDIINRVVIQSYAQKGSSGLANMNHFFRYEDSTIEDGSDISLGLFGEWYLDEYITNPKTAATWVPTDLAGIQMGVRART